MAERPQNLCPARLPERTHNSNRCHYGAPQSDTAAGSYEGSHRVERPQWADDQRSSRVGHHHTTDHHRDRSNHW